ncbi:hypothetical protein A3Q56_05610 [Intoshia linei]|uniref:Uncharacterized protein n=1 Tax=Intoshia linei TaxID=1819745 RepID=A0A177AXI0_9BILA|nr:hypothetical protein A3Q56_05610 [Intoshia linei]
MENISGTIWSATHMFILVTTVFFIYDDKLEWFKDLHAVAKLTVIALCSVVITLINVNLFFAVFDFGMKLYYAHTYNIIYKINDKFWVRLKHLPISNLNITDNENVNQENYQDQDDK